MDDLLQKLATFRWYMDMITKAEDMEHVQAYLLKMRSDFNTELIPSIRTISGTLLPRSLHATSLTLALADLCAQIEKTQYGRTHIHFESKGNEVPILPMHQEHIIRIVQELVNNAAKHSNTWHIYIQLKFEKTKIIINVEEGGKFENVYQKKFNEPENFRTLKTRIRAIGGRISFKIGERGAQVQIVYEHVLD